MFLLNRSGHHRRGPEQKLSFDELRENDIRDALSEWIETRSYREPDDNIVRFAESCGVNETEVAEYLSYHLDTDYVRLRRVLRIQDAVLLLLLFPKKPLSQIGRLVGYKNWKEFRVQFTKYTKHNPEKWHKRIISKREMPRPTRGEHRPSSPTLRLWCPIFKCR